MPVPYTPLAIANEFIARFGANAGVEHMKLQKLVYCSYGWWLASEGLEGARLTTEGPEIWRHGPVFSSLYSVLRAFGRAPISTPQSAGPFSVPERVGNDTDDIASLITWIWGRYGHLSSFALSDMTHRPGTPWHRVALERDFSVPFHTRIPDEYIFEEFSSLMERSMGGDQGSGHTENAEA